MPFYTSRPAAGCRPLAWRKTSLVKILPETAIAISLLGSWSDGNASLHQKSPTCPLWEMTMRAQTQPASAPANAFLDGSVTAVFVRTSLPIIMMTTINGLLTVADGMLLGAFVGPEALGAVTLVFPFSMLLVAAASMVGIGMASLLGRRLGGGDMAGAQQILAAAHGLAMVIAVIVIALFAAFGMAAVNLVSGGNAQLAGMGWTFLAISVATTPISFVLSMQSDALRAEGRVGFMALVGVLLTLANIGLNALLIGVFDLGVAGSAVGTALAQALALVVVVFYRLSGKARLGLAGISVGPGWGEILALGAPRSLNFIGISLGSAAVLFALQRLLLDQPEATVAAYGLVMRLMTFAFLPLLGMSLALQAIAGNAVGAGRPERAKATLRQALIGSFAYGLAVEVVLIGFRGSLGGLFVDDPIVGAEAARIIPLYVAAYFAFGPVMMLASYSQAIGDVGRSAVLSLGRTYVFAIPLTLLLPLVWGEMGIWAAAPIADMLMLGVVVALLWRPRHQPAPAA